MSRARHVTARDSPHQSETITVPTWLRPVVTELQAILALPEGWNSYRARRIEGQAAIRAVQLLLDSARPGTPPPSVLPTFPGGIQLEWHTRGVDLEVEITPQGQIKMVCEDEVRGFERTVDITENPQPLTAVLADLARRPDS
jgi:hypothetical protein